MWKTSQGDRILKGTEAELIRKILSNLWADFQNGTVDEYGITTGVVLFDALERNQQLAMLLHVGESLLVSQETPELTAVREATVYALFQCLLTAIKNEIQNESFLNVPCQEWRELTIATRRELDRLHQDETPELPPIGSDDVETWEYLTEGLADEILWDRDFEMGYLVEDEDPDNAQVLKQILDIGDNYYTDVSPDPTDAQLVEIEERLARICNHPR